MAISGMRGRVFYGPDATCVHYTCDGVVFPTVTTQCLQDEVTKFVIVDSVKTTEFGHDKSDGWTDVLTGTRKFSISLDAMWVPQTSEFSSGANNNDHEFKIIHAGRTLFLELFPIGTICDYKIAGFAVVTQRTDTVEMRDGMPIEYSLALTSRGPWKYFIRNVAVPEYPWGGFECKCVGDTESSVGSD